MNLGGHRASRFLLSYPVHISNSAKHRSAISRRIPPELCDRHALEKREGAGNAGRWPQPMARLQQKTQAAGTTGSAEHPAFPARWAYSLYVISPGTGLIAPVACEHVASQTWHQHRDARTTRFRRPDQSRSSCAIDRGHRIPAPRVVTMRIRPSARGGMAPYNHSFRK